MIFLNLRISIWSSEKRKFDDYRSFKNWTKSLGITTEKFSSFFYSQRILLILISHLFLQYLGYFLLKVRLVVQLLLVLGQKKWYFCGSPREHGIKFKVWQVHNTKRAPVLVSFKMLSFIQWARACIWKGSLSPTSVFIMGWFFVTI